MTSAPSLQDIQSVANKLQGHVVRTPTVSYTGVPISGLENSEIFIKLELLQHAGSFKARGALNNIMSMQDTSHGVTAFSAGNHAIAIAFAAHKQGVTAKVVMPKSANPFRVERCKFWGAEVIFGDNISDLMSIVEQLQRDEQRVLIHPFEGPRTIEGTATVGYELCNDVEQLDAVIVPVGGGGLIAGIASAVKQLQPNCQVIGVEPMKARGMADSIAKGSPLHTVELNSIADSLSAPMHLPLTFSVIQEQVDQFVQVSDDELRDAMRFIFTELKLAVEPACAAAMAALQGPLRTSLAGKRVGLVACGSNIDMQSYISNI
ncbi:UNVERIFIED_CONTAM: hypothetical protein GTU68_051392, partial [Idotea baltica]|nr:hypothetical protein [Idotea baltica]